MKATIICVVIAMLDSCALSPAEIGPDAQASTLVQSSTTDSYCTTTECDAYGNCWEVASDCGGAGGGGTGTGGTGGNGGGWHPNICTGAFVTCDPSLGQVADIMCFAQCGPDGTCHATYPCRPGEYNCNEPASPGYCY